MNWQGLQMANKSPQLASSQVPKLRCREKVVVEWSGQKKLQLRVTQTHFS